MDNPVVRLTWQVSERNKFAVYMDRALRLRGHAMGVADRSAHRVGDLEHADVRDRLGQVDLDAVVEAAARDRLLVQPRALRQPVSARRARRARHRRRGIATCARTTPAPASCGTRRARSSATIPIATTSRARSRTSPARTTSRSARRISSARTAATTTPTPISTRPTTTACRLQVTVLNTPLDGAGRPRRQLRHLRAGLLEPRQADRQLRRCASTSTSRRIVGQNAMQGRFANVAGLRRHRVPDVEGLLAAPLGGLRPRGRRQDGDSRRLQQVRHRADDRLRAALQPDGADHRGCCRGPTSTATTSPRASAAARFLTAGCEINFANLPTNFGIRSLAQFDPDIKRPYSLAFNLGITREVLTGLSVAVEYYRIDFKNITVRQNSLRNANSYNQFNVVSPLDGSVIPAWVHQAGVPRRRSPTSTAPATR